MNREFVRRHVRAGTSPTLSAQAIEDAITEAARILGNLIHYQSGRSHYDEDVAYLARVLLAERKP